jgi:hypothetical protein
MRYDCYAAVSIPFKIREFYFLWQISFSSHNTRNTADSIRLRFAILQLTNNARRLASEAKSLRGHIWLTVFPYAA